MSAAFRVLGPTTYAGSIDRLSPVVPSSTAVVPYQCGLLYFPGWSTPGGGPYPSAPWSVIPSDRIPLGLGAFDETNQTVVDTELTWMSQYGITFVAIDWFHQFSGATLVPYLEHFINKVIISAVTKPKFCIQHANVTNAGSLNSTNWATIYNYWIANYFPDSNYYKINGYPVVVMNSVPSFQQRMGSNAACKAALDAARAAAVTAGFPGIIFMGGHEDAGAAWLATSTPAIQGWDGITGSNVFTTTQVGSSNPGIAATTYNDLDNAVFQGLVSGYQGFLYGWMNTSGITTVWPPLTAGFDDTPWDASTTLHGMPTSAEFGSHLTHAKTLIDANTTQTQKTFLLENATEFGEGSIMFPTSGNNGFDRLRQLNTKFSLNTSAVMVPNAFSFTDITGATTSTVYTSNTITTAGINVTGDYFVTGSATVSKNGGAFNANPGTFVVGDTFALRLTSAATGNLAVTGTLTLSGISDTYSVTTADNAPTDISLSSNVVLTTAGTNAVVGALSTTDADIGDIFTYSLVAGTGSTNNASFNISGANLRCNDPNALGAGTYSVRIQTSDSASATFAKAFTIIVAAPSTGVGSGIGKLKIAIRIGVA